MTPYAELRKEQERSGKRKPIIETDDEEEQKKVSAVTSSLTACKQNDNGVMNLDQENVQEEQKESAPKEKVIKAPQQQAITSILMNHNVSLQASKNIGGNKRADETKVETKKKVVVPKKTLTLFLQNNELRSLVGMAETLEAVMWHSKNLLWLDLSYNFLTTIDEDLLEFPELKTLYLHGNYISNLEQTKKLQQFVDLQSLTLYGNAIEQIKGYRMYVLGVMYANDNQNLRRLDQVLVTNREYDNVLVWQERLYPKNFNKLKKLVPANYKPPPEKKVEEDDKKAANL